MQTQLTHSELDHRQDSICYLPFICPFSNIDCDGDSGSWFPVSKSAWVFTYFHSMNIWLNGQLSLMEGCWETLLDIIAWCLLLNSGPLFQSVSSKSVNWLISKFDPAKNSGWLCKLNYPMKVRVYYRNRFLPSGFFNQRGCSEYAQCEFPLEVLFWNKYWCGTKCLVWTSMYISVFMYIFQ